MKKYEYSFGRTNDGILANVKGYATETNNFGESAFGILNKSTIDEDNFTTTDVVTSDKASIFTVGNGTSINDRRNIIELKSNGDTYIVNVGGYDGTNADEADTITILTDIENIHDDIERIDDTIESIHIELDPDNHLIYTLLIDGENRGTINIPKDQFLKSVRYDDNTNELIFVFVTTDEDDREVRVNITDLEDIYHAGDGVSLVDHTFSIVIDPASEDYLTVGEDGLKIQGIDNINKIVYTAHSAVDVTVSPSIIEKDIDTEVTISNTVKLNGSNITPVSILIKEGDTQIFNAPNASTKRTIDATTTYTATSTIINGVTKTDTATVTAVYRMYFGGSTNASLTSEQILALSPQALKTSPSGSYSVSVAQGQYLWLCVPNGMKINKVTSSGFDVPMQSVAVVAVDGKGNYNCYRSSSMFNAGTVSIVIS